ncbi:DNA replication protein [Alicyclobacillus ferrooxydans]|uniref:DNA replication protein n=2 Tax=Alicyclobacillus ferrooxydans TaxID=471514 RepID=A0A0P9CJU0_9BACL|nr:DNA replication protein [Alicyclobacillus ferrooxydans]
MFPEDVQAKVEAYDTSYFRRRVPQLNEWGASDAQILAHRAMLLEYVRQQSICEHCQGFNACGKEGDMQGFIQTLEQYGPTLSVGVRRCRPFLEAQLRETVNRWHEFSGALKQDSEFRLGNFPVEQRRKYPKLFRYAYDFAETFEVGQTTSGLYLFGPPGVGKTHLLLGVLNRLTERGIPALFVRSDSIFDRMRHLIADNGDLEPLLEAYATVPVLGIDEFAQERANDFTLEKLFRIINHRFHSQLPTWFTSNYAPPDMYRKNGSDVHDSVPALRSRVMQMAKLARVEGDDARQRNLQSLT